MAQLYLNQGYLGRCDLIIWALSKAENILQMVTEAEVKIKNIRRVWYASAGFEDAETMWKEM